MGELILPERFVKKSKLDEVNEQNRQRLYNQVWGKYADEVDHPDKHRHALTHTSTQGWATAKPADWCPLCNGHMQAEFDKFMAEQKETADKEQYAEFLDEMGPTLDAARAEGKLTEPLPGEGEDKT